MGTIKEYIKIPQGFAIANNNSQRGLDKFGYGITIQNDYFVDVNVINTHPDLFPSLEPLEFINIDSDDILMYDEYGNIITPNYVNANSKTRASFTVPEHTLEVDNSSSKKWYQKLWDKLVNTIKNIFKK